MCPKLRDELADQGAENVGPDTDVSLYQTVVNLECIKGHYYSDNSSSVAVECMEDEQWNVTTFEACKRMCRIHIFGHKEKKITMAFFGQPYRRGYF